jgi:hypothetical protein
MSNQSRNAAARVEDQSLLADPEFPWQGDNAYDVLNKQLKASNRPTLGPMSSAAEVNDASFALMGTKAWGQLRPYWDQLRIPRTRLGIDFLHYPIPDLRVESLDPSLWDRPMPIATPDLMSIADCQIELANPPHAPTQMATREIPLSELTDFTLAELLPSPLCTEPPSLSELIEADDDQQ